MTRSERLTIESARVWQVPTGWRRAVILELTASDGTTGIGEAGVAYGTGTGSAAEMVCNMLDRHVIGRSAESLNAIWHDIYDRGFWVRNGGAIAHAGLSAIEQALWDMRGKQLGAPVFDLMGGRLRDALPVYANGWWAGCDSPDDFARVGKATVARGYAGLKFYPLGLADPVTVVRHPQLRQVEARVLTLACDRVAALREAVGPEIEIMLDFGGGLSTDQALRVLRRLEPFDILFVEEPVDPSARDAMRQVAAGTTIPIAAGERFYGRSGFASVLAGGDVSILQPDVCNTGGLSEARMIAAMGETANLRVAPHNYGSGIATAVAVQLSAMIPNFMVLEHFPDFDSEPGFLPVLDAPLEASVRNGTMPVPEGPGLGVNLNTARLVTHLYAERRA